MTKPALDWGQGGIPVPKDEWRYLLMFKEAGCQLAVFCEEYPDGAEAYPKIYDLRDLPNDQVTIKDLEGLGFACVPNDPRGAIRELPIGPLL